jgi:hypothetical protein
MEWLFLDQRAPAWLGLLATVLLGMAAVLLGLPALRWGSVRVALRTLSRTTGLLGGTLAGGVVLISGYALDAHGFIAILLWLVALLALLLLGVYLPGLEARQHAARARRLDVQAVDFTGYLIAMLQSGYGDAAVLREYIRRPRTPVLDVQTLVGEALETHARAGRGNVFDRLHAVVEQSGSGALRDVTATIRQIARQDRTQLVDGLTEQRRQQLEILMADATRRARRRENVVMLASAGSLFFGMLVFILYVMTGGGMLLPLG